ncbi:hypothetical protein C1708_31735 [Streptomyces sp. DH-12]|uniref:hypothetical protein n=1 Tax=Streptomyces sp. DH-12 TaxID=2072509 RepID=UPI000CCDC0A9|nr:hypothetical protein [Streptomyces sp. DH-12]PNV36318.1 hypothetical protein C1708_31735 [Streptomyces sp. DH-12]
MTDRDDHTSAPASGMRAEHDDHRTRPDTGWPQHTAAEDDASPEEAPEAVEEKAAVRRAVDDGTSTTALTGDDAEDNGALAPEFREPTNDDGG